MNYISRFIIGTGLLAGLLVSGGCRKQTWRDQPLGPEDTALVDAMLILRCNEMQTKAVEDDEKQINDLNLFFVHKFYPSEADPEVRHYYFSSVDVSKRIKLTNIRLGKYRLYAVANAGKSLCDKSAHDPETPPTHVGESMCSMTEQDIQDLVVRFSQSPMSPKKLLMAGFDPEMQITKNDATIQVNLKRKVAKYELTYTLAGAAVGNMAVKRIEVRSVPAMVACFKKNTLTADIPANNWEIFSTSDPKGEIFTEPFKASFYLPENVQESVPGLDLGDRYVQNAPPFATFLYIDGIYEKSQYGMSIYFGDNYPNEYEKIDPTNFEIGGNEHFVLNVLQGGPSLEDSRISSMKLEIDNDVSEWTVDEWVEMPVKITCANYFNDHLELICNVAYPTIETVKGEFEVYWDEGGSKGERLLPNANGGFDIFSTGDDGKGAALCIVRYRQVVARDKVRLALTVNSRLGTTSFEDQEISFKY